MIIKIGLNIIMINHKMYYGFLFYLLSFLIKNDVEEKLNMKIFQKIYKKEYNNTV